MLRGLRYIALIVLLAWIVWNLWTRERRRRIDEGFRRAAVVISLAFVTAGGWMLYRAMSGPAGDVGQALLMIAVGAAMILYQQWGRS